MSANIWPPRLRASSPSTQSVGGNANKDVCWKIKWRRCCAPCNRIENLKPPEPTVNAAYQYLHKRRAHLDYAGARRQGLPIGSGEIASGHRHVIQQRLKLAGCWWKKPHAQTLLNLRVARANNLWNSYS